MWLKSVSLENFRNFKKKLIEFSEGANILSAENGRGKSNMLEAISYLSIPRSYRGVRDLSLLRNIDDNVILAQEIDESLFDILGSFAKVTGNVFSENEKSSLCVVINKNSKGVDKNFFVDSEAVSLKTFLGRFRSVMFSPEIVDSFNLSPACRRTILDRLMGGVNPEYVKFLLSYNNALRNRNSILSDYRNFDKGVLDIWTRRLVDNGAQMILARHEFVEKTSSIFRDIINKMLRGEFDVDLRYSPSFDIEKSDDIENIKNLFDQALESSLDTELARGHTIIGPHRDDYNIFFGSTPMREFASRGQQRIGVTALLIAYVEKLKNSSNGDFPVLLLDDVFSELDLQHRKMLVNSIMNSGFQSIITAVDLDIFDKKLFDGVNMISID